MATSIAPSLEPRKQGGATATTATATAPAGADGSEKVSLPQASPTAQPKSAPGPAASQSPTSTVPAAAPRTTQAPAARDDYAGSQGGNARGSGSGGSLLASGSEGGQGLASSAEGDVASLTRAPGLTENNTVRVESLGDASAMSKDLLDALAAGRGLNPAQALASATALLAMAQKAVDNIPHRLVDSNDDRGTRFYQAPASAPGNQRTAELTFLRAASTRVQATDLVTHGPDWPAMMLEGLTRASATWPPPQQGLGPEADWLTRASLALYGRELTTLGPKHSAEDIFRAASLANAPLALPTTALLDVGGELRGFVVLATQQNAAGEQSLVLLDVAQSIAENSEVHRTMQAEKFVATLNALLVPNGKPAISTERQQEEALHTLGLIGCCLTSGGGNVRANAGALRATGPRSGRGLLENRCLTCAQAQQLCQPGAAPKPSQPPLKLAKAAPKNR